MVVWFCYRVDSLSSRIDGMTEPGCRIEDRFEAYVAALSGAFGHADRRRPFHDYCSGLLLPAERKSVEPMAALVAPDRVSAKHQSLLHFVGQADWSDGEVLAKVRALVLPALEQEGAIEAWIVDDSGIPKKGVHSVGVARQYCGRLGKQDNCQVAVMLSVANHAASLPLAYRLYLPQEWATDPVRRAKAGVPDTVRFKTKPEIALEQIGTALADGIAPGIVLADAAYGCNGPFRAALAEMGLTYAVAIQSNASFWPPDVEPLPAKPWSGKGRPPSQLRRAPGHAPVSAKTLAMRHAAAFATVSWREGSNTLLTSRFAAWRVRPSARRAKLRPAEWLLVEWPEGQAEPTRYWLSTLPEDTELAVLVDRAKLRWRIERDYQELKSELGLAHYEGRGWRGFHHHATLTIAAYGFLIRERAALPPSATQIRQIAALPPPPRPRGSPDPARATRAQLHRNHPKAADRCPSG
jgi:SRSO17 transposase